MKYIIYVILTLIVTTFSILVILDHTEKQYQSVIVIAVSTACVQLVLFFLKLFFDNNSTKQSKAFNVIYDKRFLAYHSMFDEMFLAKLDLLNFVKICNQESEEKSYNSIRKFHTSILSNKLLLSNKLYNHLNDMYFRFFKIYENTSKIRIATNSLSLDEINFMTERCKEDLRYLTENIPFNEQYLEIEKLMKKELHID